MKFIDGEKVFVNGEVRYGDSYCKVASFGTVVKHTQGYLLVNIDQIDGDFNVNVRVHKGTVQTVDVTVENHGTLFLFSPITQAAKDWVEKNVQLENYMRLGNSFACEHRFAQALADGMRDSGLLVM
jgi:hypothetical protein